MIAIVADEPMAELAEPIGAVLGVELRPRSSGYYGDPYYSGWPDSDVKLTLNRDPMYRAGDPEEDRFFSAESPDARYVVWEADAESERVAELVAAGVTARVVGPA